MHPHEALAQIDQIRAHMARATMFRGYRSATTACSGLLGLVGCVQQVIFLPNPSERPYEYVTLWCIVCISSLAVVEIAFRAWRSKSTLERETTLAAVQQFLPSLVVGGLVTYLIVQHLPQVMWMLPGLWAIFMGLGIFSSARMLPRSVAIVGGYYVLAGLACLDLARGPWMFSPWAMGLTFVVGQFLAAFILWWTLERKVV
jgi:hypothetical protein